MAGIVVIFDFDKTIIDCDSDNWVLDELGATELFNQLFPTMAWNPLMDRMMKELYFQGIKIEDIVGVLKRTPIHPRIIEAIKSAHALGCDLRIGMVIESIQASLAKEDEKKTIIYLGDGIGDYCSAVKLGDEDYLMPRKNFPVWDLICQKRSLIKAEINEWSNGEEFEQVLLRLISKVSIEKINSSQPYSVDCKLQTLPGAAHEAFTPALSVRH
ncbi:Phosphatase PHOSPHO-type [Corchorus capsularis]|uniref:Phosphatase PHOSPHO-type n=1 Tax=Corchorus capsularis TaxID=210143 RepID=A0A1R3HKG6_COCAP|nr:Phosphatase PHOSPHO-type [Corchorus capsularis]